MLIMLMYTFHLIYIIYFNQINNSSHNMSTHTHTHIYIYYPLATPVSLCIIHKYIIQIIPFRAIMRTCLIILRRNAFVYIFLNIFPLPPSLTLICCIYIRLCPPILSMKFLILKKKLISKLLVGFYF